MKIDSLVKTHEGGYLASVGSQGCMVDGLRV